MSTTDANAARFTGQMRMHLNLGRQGHVRVDNILFDGEPTGITKSTKTVKYKVTECEFVDREGNTFDYSPKAARDPDELVTWLMLHKEDTAA